MTMDNTVPKKGGLWLGSNTPFQKSDFNLHLTFHNMFAMICNSSPLALRFWYLDDLYTPPSENAFLAKFNIRIESFLYQKTISTM